MTDYRVMARLVFYLSLLLWGATIYLVFLVPRMAGMWAATGEQVSAPVLVLLKVSHACRAVGFAVLPLLLLVTVGSVAWYASERRTERDRVLRASATAGL